MFVDTSALIAILNIRDPNHERAAEFWADALDRGLPLTTTNYVITETTAVAQRQLGMAAVRALTADALPVLDIRWVEPDTHGAALGALLVANRRDLSLVDCVSFETMRQLQINEAFVFDSDFAANGFDCLPRL